MATASIHENPTDTFVSLIPVSNKLQDKMNTLRDVIDNKKSLVRQVSEEMKQLIDQKTQLIISELEAIWDDTNQRLQLKRDEIHRKIKDLNKLKMEMDRIFKELGQTPLFNQIDEQIESVKREMDIDIPFVKLNWKVEQLRDSINALCGCEQRTVKFRKDIPIQLKWSTCDKGQEDNQLYNPCGVAVDSITDRIYVADWDAKRVQIFSRDGHWIQCLRDEQMLEPVLILITYYSIFVQCGFVVVKFKRSSLRKETCYKDDNNLSGICTDSMNIFVGYHKKTELMKLTTDLEEVKRIPLITEFKREDTSIRDISLARDVIYVALTATQYPIQAFSKEGILLRCVVSEDMLGEISYMCLDKQLNILITDGKSSDMKIFSNEGQLISKIGKEGTAEGEFTFIRGIAVDDLYSIIVADIQDHNMLQVFSPL